MAIPKITTQPYPIKELDKYFWFEHGVLMQADMYPDGTLKKNSSGQVTGPSIGEISIINNRLSVRLTPDDFPWVRR